MAHIQINQSAPGVLLACPNPTQSIKVLSYRFTCGAETTTGITLRGSDSLPGSTEGPLLGLAAGGGINAYEGDDGIMVLTKGADLWIDTDVPIGGGLNYTVLGTPSMQMAAPNLMEIPDHLDLLAIIQFIGDMAKEVRRRSSERVGNPVQDVAA